MFILYTKFDYWTSINKTDIYNFSDYGNQMADKIYKLINLVI